MYDYWSKIDVMIVKIGVSYPKTLAKVVQNIDLATIFPKEKRPFHIYYIKVFDKRTIRSTFRTIKWEQNE